ncbi:sugar phosphate nucleotidyltransferase [Umezawaea sp. Da 62-37]|uniref:sugar phosphate nucleotidyltransferase n=1 Tax=Umezawaea sp. Da 62-37 TaxID=3075927 RepID=UPI0028F72D6A|nr:sugar phosphate nucleotidyltransferase [Umezawaea sp. Da 62-37]WNV90066.1 sugar phosphate nucleotidyltransferase [Umezawaea sp. Da 62-37]
MHDVRAALLAGGLGERMGTLTARTCKPLVPYAASCRLVDFSVDNALRSGIPELVLMSLHRERDLIDHLLRGWDDSPLKVHFGPHDDLVRDPSFTGPLPERAPELGTADALIANAEYLFAPGARDVLVQHADHVYTYDYGDMLRAHRESGADVTIGVQAIERRYVKLFGMVEVNDDLTVRRLVEKPPNPTSDLIFTAFCLFRVDTLVEVLAELSALGEDGWQHDISRDVLPAMIASGRKVLAHPITGYWADIGTVERYHSGQLGLIDHPETLNAPLTLGGPAPRRVDGNLVAGDLPTGADVRSSVLFPGCAVEPGAVVHRSVVLPGARIAAGVEVVDTVVEVDEHLHVNRHGIADLEP